MYIFNPLHSKGMFQRVLKLVRRGMSITKACAAASVPIQTLRDRQGLAELYCVDRPAYDEEVRAGTERRLLDGLKVKSVADLEASCRSALSARIPQVLHLRQKGKLIPFTKLY